MKLTRQQMAGIAFALLLIAVVVLHLVGGDSAHDVAERLEGAMGLALTAFLGETVVRARTGLPGAMLLLVLGLVGCGGAMTSLHDDACKATRDSCDLALASQARYCGADADPDRATACALTSASAAVCVASLQLWCPAPVPSIQRTYPGDVAADEPQGEITMGMFRVEVQAVGNHLCQRAGDYNQDGLAQCADPSCTDCITRRYVEELRRQGASVEIAQIRHWPTSQPVGPVDNLLTGRRRESA